MIFEKECDFSADVLCRLSDYFHVFTEVNGVHFTGKRKRIDAVIKPRFTGEWKNKNIAFGIEFKRRDAYLDMTDVSKMIRQAYDYLYTDFERFGKIPVLVCPLKIQSQYETKGEMAFLRRVLGKFGIGEIRETHRGLSIIFQNDHFVWDEKYGISLGKTWSFKFD